MLVQLLGWGRNVFPAGKFSLKICECQDTALPYSLWKSMMCLTFHDNAAPKWVLLGAKDEGNEGSIFQALWGRSSNWDTSSDLVSGLSLTQASPMATVPRKAKQKHPLDFLMVVWFHRIKIALCLRLITNNYNVIGHHLAQNVRCPLCYQLIKNVPSEHVFYLLLFALYYFCITLKTFHQKVILAL